MRIEEVANDDLAGLDALLQFAARHGRPRATNAAAYVDLVRNDAIAWQAFVARDEALRAAAQATISPSIGLDQVQLNAFLAPGEQDAFESVLAAVDTWGGERGATHVTAHVSQPTDEQLDAWFEAGFEQVGERARVVREVSAGDAALPLPEVAGVDIVALAERPELDDAAEALWRAAHRDVPSALRFGSADLPSMRTQLGLVDGDPWPWYVLVAIDEPGRVVGLVVGIARSEDRPTVLGHRMTGVAPDWRGRGLARAMKTEFLRRAARAGVTMLEASNDDANAPMRAINDRLGYRVDHRLVLVRRAIGRA